ncbi:MAG: response regulator, partial [Pseudomonadota bacterium]
MEPAANARELDLKDLSVLIVEPSKSQRQALRRYLAQQKITAVCEAASGKEAFDALDGGKHQLVISAMYLPDMTASDLITSLRDDPERSEIPFMLLSSEARSDLLEPIRQAGVIALLSKPVGQNALRRALLNTLQFLNPDALSSEFYDPA